MRITRAKRPATAATAATALVVALALLGCGSADVRAPTPALAGGGDQEAGRQAIIDTGCGACHRIPGIPDAQALVGPPLDSWSGRSFIAGTLPNTARNLSRWLEDPQAIRPGSAMPDLGLTETQIADIVAYLFSLR